MNRINILFILILLIGCTEKDIKGHWHIHPEGEKNGEYLSLDIDNDSVAYLEKYSIYDPLKGDYNPKDRLLLFPGACGAFRFRFQLNGDELRLENYIENYIGKKCDFNCCNRIKDQFNTTKIFLNIPKLKENRPEAFVLCDKASFETMVIGKVKSKYRDHYVDSTVIELSTNLISIEGIRSWVDHLKNKGGEWQLLKIRIIADQEVNTNYIQSVIEELKYYGFENIFLTCLLEGLEEGKFIYLNSRKLKIKNGIILKDFLK